MTTIAQMKSDHGTVYSARQAEYDDAQVQIREILDIAYHHGIGNGEMQELIVKQFGRRIENHDVSIFSEIRTWIINNWFRKDQILSPELHEKCMTAEDKRYSEWFTFEEIKHNMNKAEQWQDK